MKKLFLFLIISCASVEAKAEYRAYQYLVKNNDPYALATKASAQMIVSTLNPSVFQSYHGGNYIKLELLRTWMCPGYTGKGQRVCDHPYDKETPPP